jgi:hypothetical protein
MRTAIVERLYTLIFPQMKKEEALFRQRRCRAPV